MPYNLENLIVTNAAGEVKTLDQARKLLASSVTRITVGSITAEQRLGNIGDTYYFDQYRKTGWNSRGLPNPGCAAVRLWLAEFHGECREAGKELCVSIAGFSPEEYASVAGELMPYADALEINAGCPNAWKDDAQKPIASRDPELLRSILRYVRKVVRGRRKTVVKISPIMQILRKPIADVLNDEDVEEVLGINTEPDQEGVRADGSPALSWREAEGMPLRHTGGKSGAGIKALALDVGAHMRSLLSDDIPYVSGGGIFEGRDAAEHLATGAEGFFIGTAFFEYGPKIFGEVLSTIPETA